MQPPSSRFGKTVVIQAFPGIGDTVWFLPFLRAIAAQSEHGKITLVTKASSHAQLILGHDPMIEEIIYTTPKGQGHWGTVKMLSAQLKGKGFTTAWILHKSARYSEACWLAGIPHRYGYGVERRQRLTLNQRPCLPFHFKPAHPFEKLRRLLAMHGMQADEQAWDTTPAPEATAIMLERLGHYPRPWFVIGMGSNDPNRRWDLAHFARVADYFASVQPAASIFVIGAPHEAANAAIIKEKATIAAPNIIPVTDMRLDQIGALMAQCTLFFGNDSGPLNLAATMGAPTVGLFRRNFPLTYRPNIHCILAPEGAEQNVSKIDPAEVIATLETLKHLYG